MLAVLFIVIIAMAGLGLVVVNAMAESAWATFTIGVTIPLAIFMGLYMYKFRKGHIVEATVIGVIGLFFAVIFGEPMNHATSGLGAALHMSRNELLLCLAIYGFAASVLPVWLLLSPRDYLSSFMKIGTILLLVFGVMYVNPELKMPAFSEFTSGGGPIIPGPLFPFAFITIACGAISGFHALVSSGTTPKMVDKETNIRPIGYGAMLIEGLVGVMALIAATAMHPGDYYAINTPAHVFETLNMPVVNLPALEVAVGEQVAGRTGGAVSLAVGMAQIFSALPGMSGLIAYWYHFAIMFEALFILTTIDAGTRVGRFLVQEFIGRAYKPFARPDWVPGSVIATTIVVAGWSFFIYTGEINTIWPMFGIANQLLASVALATGTTLIIKSGKAKYAWVTAAPLAFLATNTLYAGLLSVTGNFWPMTASPDPKISFTGYVQTFCTVVMMVCVVIVLVAAARRSLEALKGRQAPELQPNQP
jgi:carbon starvation protein